jgi:hypothetical protein
LKVDDDLAALDGRREGLSRLVAEQAGARPQVELPQVVGAAKRLPAYVAVDQRVPCVRARVLERVHLTPDAEERELATVDRDERTVAAGEDLEGDAVRQAA